MKSSSSFKWLRRQCVAVLFEDFTKNKLQTNKLTNLPKAILYKDEEKILDLETRTRSQWKTGLTVLNETRMLQSTIAESLDRIKMTPAFSEFVLDSSLIGEGSVKKQNDKQKR